MRYGGIVLAATAVLALAGCTSSVAGTPQALPIAGTALAVAVDKDKVDKPKTLTPDEVKNAVPEVGEGAPIVERVLVELKRKTLSLVEVEGKIGGACKDNALQLGPNAVTDCTVSYEDLEVPWQVTIGGNYKAGDMFFTYTAKPSRGVLLRAVVHSKLVSLYGPRNVPLRCDEMPERKLVEQNKDSGVKCQYLETTREGLAWRDLPVLVDGGGQVRFRSR